MKVLLKDIRKSFGKVHVLKNVNLELLPGEVHALMGENGAGKSTLIKVLTGVYTKDAGQVYINDELTEIQNIRESQDLGIAYVHQELNVVREMSVYENMFLGNELMKNRFSIDNDAMIKRCREQLKVLNIDIDPEEKMKNLSVGYQQMIEIAKALLHESELIILDEPTAALTNKEIDTLFDVIRLLQKKGKTFLYVSHRMEEIFELCDRVTILRDGKYIGTELLSNITESKMVEMMVGNTIDHLYTYTPAKRGKVILEVKHLSKEKKFIDVSFKVHEGEILGFAGLMGSGRSDVMHAIFGSNQADSGEIFIQEKKVEIKSPRDAKKHRIAFVTEDRKEEGLILDFDIKENIVIPSLNDLSNHSMINEEKNIALAKEEIESLNIKTTSYLQALKNLSGGNQQKVVFAKWLATKPKILILDEPTRGVDVGAKKEIYNIINALKAQGVAIILVSSELPEVIGISDRILVMHSKRKAHIFNKREDFTQENILGYAFMGGKYDELQNKEL